MGQSYFNCMNYDLRVHPYKELALYQTIDEYNKLTTEKLSITQFQLDLLKKLEDEIKIDNEEFRKYKRRFRF